MTALEINLVSPAGPAQIGWWTQFSKPTQWATVCQPPFQMQPLKKKIKGRLKLNEFSSIHTRTQTYLNVKGGVH